MVGSNDSIETVNGSENKVIDESQAPTSSSAVDDKELMAYRINIFVSNDGPLPLFVIGKLGSTGSALIQEKEQRMASMLRDFDRMLVDGGGTGQDTGGGKDVGAGSNERNNGRMK